MIYIEILYYYILIRLIYYQYRYSVTSKGGNVSYNVDKVDFPRQHDGVKKNESYFTNVQVLSLFVSTLSTVTHFQNV